MNTLRSLIGSTSFKGFLAALGIVVVAALAGRMVFASEPSPQQLAASELPTVQEEIDQTQLAADRNAKAKERKAQLLDCIQNNNCSPLAAERHQP
jgi:hypothetical protein